MNREIDNREFGSRKIGKVKPLTILMSAAIACIVWLGCGVKSPPIPPEAARPQKILNLQATSSKDGVRLTWSRPETYAGGGKMRDLGGFTIARSDGDEPYKKIADVMVTDQGRFQVQQTFTYLDSSTTLNKSYKYQVVSSTTDGYNSEASNTATVVRKIPPPPPNPENFVVPTPTPLH